MKRLAEAPKDVAAYEVVGGVPACHIRWRFDRPVAEALTGIAWWDWPHDRLRAALPDIRALPIEAFVQKYRHG